MKTKLIFLVTVIVSISVNISLAQKWEKLNPNILYATDKHGDTSAVKVGIGTTNPQFPLQVAGTINSDSLVINNGAHIFGKLHIGSESLVLGGTNYPGSSNDIYTTNGDLYIQCEAGNFNTIFNWDVATNSNLGSVGIGTETPFGTPALPATSGIFGLEVNNDINLTSQQLGHGYRLGGPVILHNFGSNNIFVGEGAGSNISLGGQNSFVGFNAGHSCNNGDRNSLFGNEAGYSLQRGVGNTFVGDRAGYNFIGNTAIGQNNTFVGRSAGLSTTESYGNTFIGFQSGRDNVSGSNNTAIGPNSGMNIINGQNNTFIGENANTSKTDITSSTAIGHCAFVTQDYSIVLGYIPGLNTIPNSDEPINVGIGTTSPQSTLEIVDLHQNLQPGYSGLQLSSLINDMPINTPVNGVLSVVPSTGKVILVPGGGINNANNGTSISNNTVVLGNDLNGTTATLLNDREIPMDNHNLVFTQPGRIGIGTIDPKFRLDLAGGTFGFGNWNARTEWRPNAGLQGNLSGTGAQSGFFETDSPSNFPTNNANEWWHLIDCRHSNPNNNFALQIAGKFNDQRLWFRKTNDNPSTPWTEILTTSNGVLNTCGTANIVPVMTSPNSIGCSQIFDDGNFVGINTVFPFSKLHLFDNNNPALSISTSSAMLQLGIATCNGCFSGIATTNDAVLRADGGGTQDLIITTTNSNQGAIRFAAGNGNTEMMTIKHNGRTGIGTVNPNNLLEINTPDPLPNTTPGGNSGLRFTDLRAGLFNPSTPIPNQFNSPAVLSVDAYGNVILVPDNGSNNNFGNVCGNAQQPLTDHWEIPLNSYNFIFSGNGDGMGTNSVAIGELPAPLTCTPLSKLMVFQNSGSIDYSCGLHVINVDNNTTVGSSNTDIGIKSHLPNSNLHTANPKVAGWFEANTTSQFYNQENFALFVPNGGGKVNIGYDFSTATTSYPLDVNGQIRAYTWVSPSDSVLKTNVIPLSNSLNVLRNIPVVSFSYNGKGGFSKVGNYVGTIAENLAQFAPYAIDTTYMILDSLNTNNFPILNVDHGAVLYTTVNAVKELDSITTNLSLHSVTQASNGCNILNGNEIEFGSNALKHDTKLPLNEYSLSFEDPQNSVQGKNLFRIGDINNNTKAKFTVDNNTEYINGLFRSTKQTQFSENIALMAEIDFVAPKKYAGYFNAVGDAEANFGIYTSASKGKTNYGIYSYAPGKYPTDVAGYFVGDVYTSGNYIGSDAMLKQNIAPITNAMSIINQLQPKTFNFDTINYARLSLPIGNQYGLIAQDVETILPDLVKEVVQPAVYDTLGNIVDSSLTFKALKYESFIPVLLQGAKELQNTNNALESKIDSLENIITSYESRLSSIESILSLCCTQNKSASQTDVNATIEISTDPSLNKQTQLYQNRPNPFNAKTTFAYSLGEGGHVELIIEDSFGRMVKTVVNENQVPGEYSIDWYAESLTSGIYFYSLKVNGIVLVKKAIKF